jgi:methyl-accepting chemotaxis protein
VLRLKFTMGVFDRPYGDPVNGPYRFHQPSYVALANQAERTLAGILASARSSQEMTAQIARTTEEQSRGTARVMEAISGVATSAQSIAENTRDQTVQAGQIRRNVTRLREVARKVQEQSEAQREAAGGVMAVVEAITRKMGAIERAHVQQSESNARILSSVHGIAQVTERYRRGVATLMESVTDLTRGAGWIEEEIGQFHGRPDDTPAPRA